MADGRKQPRKKQAELGVLWLFEPAPGLKIPLCAAEHIETGPYRGCCVSYAFRPDVELQSIVAARSAEFLLFPPLIIDGANFTKGVFVQADILGICKVPYYPRHAFYDKHEDDYRDCQADRVAPVSYPTGEPGLSSIAGLCGRISRALNIKLDARKAETAALDKTFPVRNLKDDSVNRKTAVLTISIPRGEPGPPSAIDLGEIAERIEELLRAKKLGEHDGGGSGVAGAEMVFLVKPRRYPEALQLIRHLLEELKFGEYSVWAYEPR